jgi:hypothetical protein
MTKDEALKLALEALEAVGAEFVCRATHHHKKDQHGGLDDCPNQARHEKAITAIKQALAAPVQPVKPSLWEQYHAARQEHEPENEPFVSLASVQEPNSRRRTHDPM